MLSREAESKRIRDTLSMWKGPSPSAASVSSYEAMRTPAAAPIAPTARMNKLSSLVNKAAACLPVFIQHIQANKHHLDMAGSTSNYPPLPIAHHGHPPKLADTAAAINKMSHNSGLADKVGALLVHAMLCAAVNNVMVRAVHACEKASHMLQGARAREGASISMCSAVTDAAQAVKVAVLFGLMWGTCAPPRSSALSMCTVEVDGSNSSKPSGCEVTPNVLRKVPQHGWQLEIPISKVKGRSVDAFIPPNTLLFCLLQQYAEWAAEILWQQTMPPPELDSRPPFLQSIKLSTVTGTVHNTTWLKDVWRPLMSHHVIPFIRTEWLSFCPPSEQLLEELLPSSHRDVRHLFAHLWDLKLATVPKEDFLHETKKKAALMSTSSNPWRKHYTNNYKNKEDNPLNISNVKPILHSKVCAAGTAHVRPIWNHRAAEGLLQGGQPE